MKLLRNENGLGEDELKVRLEEILSSLDVDADNGEESFRLQADAVKSLATEYETVFRIDLATNYYNRYKFSILTSVEKLEHGEEEKKDFFRFAQGYVKRRVHQEDRERVLKEIDKYLILRELVEKGIYTVSYRANLNGEYRCYQAKFAFISDNFVNKTALVLGVCDIDAMKRQEEALLSILEKNIQNTKKNEVAEISFFAELESRLSEIIFLLEIAEEETLEGKTAKNLSSIKKKTFKALEMLKKFEDKQ